MIRMTTKYFWAATLLFIAVSVWLLVQIAVLILEDRLRVFPRPLAAQRAPAAEADKAPAYERYASIPARNIFNPGEKGLKLLPLEEGKRTSVKEAAENILSSVGPNYRLVGTVTGAPGSSYAILQEGADRKQRIYRQRAVVNGWKIVRISRQEICLARQGREEILSLRPEEIRSPAAPGPAPGGGEVVKKLSANRFLVNREDVTAAIGNVNQFMTQARFKPHFTAGRPGGFSISEIQPQSLMAKVGLQNNDVIKKVNGQMLTKPEEVFQAYSQLQRDGQIEVEIERQGRLEVLRYEIR